VRHLDVVPQVYEDEPWQASTAYKLLTSGVFGSDLFTGFYHMDERYYGFMPLHPLVLAGVFRVFGPGLVQARLETVGLTLLVLVLTFALGARLFSAWVGALAVALLVLVRWTGLTYVQLTGIPLVDFARIARYDPLVPVLGLASLHAYLWARAETRRWQLYAAAGFLAGLAGLAHLYGLFWLPVLLALTAWDGRLKAGARIAAGGRLNAGSWIAGDGRLKGSARIAGHGRRKAGSWIAVGAVLPWLPYAAYVLTDLPDWRGQTLIYASRFDLLNPAWYLDNLLQEYHRYGPGLGPFGPPWLSRVGFWLVLFSLPAAMAVLVRRAIASSDAAARTIIVPAILLPVLFALLIKLKLVNYTLVELPIFALVIAWGGVTLWRTAWARSLLVVVAAAVTVEGGAQLVHLEQAALTTTPYPTFITQVRQYLPPGARVLGLHSYWFGLEDFEYRSFLVPLNWADEGVPLDEGLSRVAPDVVLMDARLRDYFNAPEVAADRARLNDWFARHGAEVVGRVDDPTYGLMEVYRVRR
jgi:hypothetical protein